MGLFSDIFSIIGAVGGIASAVSGGGGGRMSLEQAKSDAPNSMGCYKIYLRGDLKYVGKAEDGIRKRFVQYYNGTTTHYTSGKLIHEHRDNITVSWKVLSSREECKRVESEWINQYNPEWNKCHPQY